MAEATKLEEVMRYLAKELHKEIHDPTETIFKGRVTNTEIEVVLQHISDLYVSLGTNARLVKYVEDLINGDCTYQEFLNLYKDMTVYQMQIWEELNNYLELE